MSNSLKSVKLSDGISFNTVNDSRFKTNRISVNFITPLNAENATVNALIPQILKKGYKGCESYTELNRRLQELYGAYIEGNVSKRGDMQVIKLAVVGIDDRFALDHEIISEKAAQILCSLLFNPITENGGFSSEYTELEKKALVDAIESELNDKRTYALNNAIKIMCADEPYGLPKYGFKDKVAEITNVFAKQKYDELLKTARVEIIFTGCGDETAAFNVIKSEFAKISRSYKAIDCAEPHIKNDEIKEEIEKVKVNQSKLVLGFFADASGVRDNVPAMRLMCTILGGTPSSKLFLNVREKLSLCYYCAAMFDLMKGVITIDSGVETENIYKAKEAISAQLDAMKKGDFTDEDIDFARLSLENSFKSIYESDYTIESFYLGRLLLNSVVTPEEEIEKIKKVTRGEIIKAAATVQLDTVYTLTESEDK